MKKKLTYEQALHAAEAGFFIKHELSGEALCSPDGVFLYVCGSIEDTARKTGELYNYENDVTQMESLPIDTMLSKEPEWQVVQYKWDTGGILPFVILEDCPDLLVEQIRLQFPEQLAAFMAEQEED